MVTIRHERPDDLAAREVLLDLCFGAARFAKSSERLREGRRPAAGLSFVASDCGRVIGTVRLWHVAAGGVAALLLGPLAVDPVCRGRDIGAALMRRALRTASRAGHGAIILVGDPLYYSRFGFSANTTARMAMPGPFERHRLLAIELIPGALAATGGEIVATGARLGRSDRPSIGRLVVQLPQAA